MNFMLRFLYDNFDLDKKQKFIFVKNITNQQTSF